MDEKELTDILRKAAQKKRKRLDLSGRGLLSLPSEIAHLHTLTHLDLSNNRLTSLPSEIGQLANLSQLYIRANQLGSLPSEIGQLTNLTQLIVSSNRLISLPPEIGQLKSLNELVISGNRLISLPSEIGELSNLTQLTLTGNHITILPSDIGRLSRLTQLYLSRNRLKSVPSEIGKLKLLTNLDLSHNKLTMLPREIAELKHLRQFDLNRNMLDIPPEVLKKKPQTIIAYYFSDQKKENHTQNKTVIRSIEFPPEYHQAGISILNYFGTVLRKKYPDTQAKIRIEQDGLKVSMTVDPGNGTRETIERALDEYGLVVIGKLAPEEFTDDRLLMIELKSKLRIAHNEIEMQKDLLKYQDNRIRNQEIQINRFLSLMETAFHRPISMNISQIQGDREDMGDSITISAQGDVGFAKDQANASIDKRELQKNPKEPDS